MGGDVVPNVERMGQTLIFRRSPVITAWASVAGKKEAEGPLGASFDLTAKQTKLGASTWERAESRLQALAMQRLLQKREIGKDEVDLVFSGDLLNQCIGSSFFLRNTGLPSLGLYGACSTMAEALLLSGAFVNAGYARRAAALTSSHFAASERQYRFPLGYGGQRTPTAQWTVTGAGAVLVEPQGEGPVIPMATVGTVRDKGIKDANNMGAAMAFAAYDTIRAHLRDTGRTVEDYDLIATGDLGKLGKAMVEALFRRDGVELGGRYQDCGVLIYDPNRQDTHCGGSGCGCSAVVLCADLLRRLRAGRIRRLLFCGTGALLSPVSVQQKRSVPAICHAVVIERQEAKA